MAWRRRDEPQSIEGEQEWISNLLEPLQRHVESDDADAGSDHGESVAPLDGAQKRSVADVISQAQPTPQRTEPESRVAEDVIVQAPLTQDVVTEDAPEAADSGTDADPRTRVGIRSVAEVLAAAAQTGEVGDESLQRGDAVTAELVIADGVDLSEPSAERDDEPANLEHDRPSAEAGRADLGPVELPVAYVSRIPTTGEIPAVGDDSTNIGPTLAEVMHIEGALGAALVAYSSGEMLGAESTGLDVTVAAAGDSAVIRAKIASLVQLDLDDEIDEVSITLGTQYHLMRMVNDSETPGLFLYLVLGRSRANLAMARHKLALAARQLSV